MVKDSTINKLKGIMEDLDQREILLLILNSTSLNDISPPLMEYITAEKDNLVVYVTVAKPYTALNKKFEEAGAKTDNIFYIDCASNLGGGAGMERSGNVVFLKPSQLTDISIAMTETIEKLPEDKGSVLFFDTISTLMIYNSEEVVTKFAHLLSSKMRKWNIKSVVLTADEDTPKGIRSRLEQFSDRHEEIND